MTWKRTLPDECVIDGCTERPVAKDLCQKHYAASRSEIDRAAAKARREARELMPPLEGARRTGRPGWDARSDRKIARQNAVLEGIRAGKTVKDSCRLSGTTVGAYQQWRNQDPSFRSKADDAKLAGNTNPDDWSDFRAFRRHYFEMETYPHQARIVDALNHMVPREIILVNIWPESGKTSTLEDKICQWVAEEPNLRIVDVSEADDLCKKSIGKIKNRMTDTANFGEFIAAFGPFYEDGQERRGKPWKTQYFTVAQANNDERDYTMQARAITSAAYGSRLDKLLVDDCQSLRNLNQTKTILGHLQQTYFTRGKTMECAIIGTRIGRGDISEALVDAGIVSAKNIIVIPAVQPDGTLTCPEMWLTEIERDDLFDDEEVYARALERVKLMRQQVGERVWFASYQQMPYANELATFTDAMIDECLDYDRGVAPSQVGDYVALSLDPALGGGNSLTAAAHHLDKFVVLDQQITYGMSRTEDILGNVEEFVRRYFPSLLIIERDAMQKHLIGDNRLIVMQSQYGFQVVPHTSSRNKADPILGVASMAGGFMRKEIRLPYADEFSRTRMDALRAQLRAWRGDVPTRMLVQDGVMSLWFNWRYWQENRIARADGDIHQQWNRGGTPYTPTDYQKASVR